MTAYSIIFINMKSCIFTIFLFAATFVSGQSTVSDIVQQLGVTYGTSGAENTMLVVNEETIGMVGSHDAYGYMTCFSQMAKAHVKATQLYGERTVIKTEGNKPSYIDAYEDYNRMETAISVGSAWVSIIWKYEVNNAQDLYLNLDCHKGSYSFLIILQNKPEVDALGIADVADALGIKYLTDSIASNTLRLSEDVIIMRGTIDSLGFASVHQAFLSYHKIAEATYGKVTMVKTETNIPSSCKIGDYREVSRALERKKSNIYVIWSYAASKSKDLMLVLKCEKGEYIFLMMLR